MTDDERVRYEGFRFERDRRLFLATRVLVRTVLSHYAPVTSADWRFATGAHGKPYVAHPRLTRPIHFNVSHTPGLVACVVSVVHEAVGVDVERSHALAAAMPVAERYFAAHPRSRPSERSPRPISLRRFVACWTLKESYIKARGLGLTLPLDQCAFRVDVGPIEVDFEFRHGWPTTRPAGDSRCSTMSPQHVLAVGVDTGGAAALVACRPERRSRRLASPAPRLPSDSLSKIMGRAG